jgi:hypothetical protein
MAETLTSLLRTCVRQMTHLTTTIQLTDGHRSRGGCMSPSDYLQRVLNLFYSEYCASN